MSETSVVQLRGEEHGCVSGDRIELGSFKRGWLLGTGGFRGDLGHYYEQRTFGSIESLCGREYRPRIRDSVGYWACEPGTYANCKACMRALLKLSSP